MIAECPPTAVLSPRARRLLVVWAVGLAVLFLAAGVILYRSLRANQQAAADRHAARLDPDGDEPGVTAADRSLPAGATPIRVTAGMYVDRVAELSVKDGNWTVDFFLWFRWRGDALKSCEEFQVVDGSVEKKDKEEDATVSAERYQRFRVAAKLTKVFDVTRFPRDDHLLLLSVELPEHLRQDVQFVPDADGSAVSSRVSVPAYKLRLAGVVEKPHSYKTARGDPRLPAGAKSTYSQLRMGLTLERGGWGLYFKMFQSLYVAVLLALLAFFIRPTEVDPRFGLGVGALFAGVANAYVISSLVPDTGVMSLADVVNGVGIATILLTVVQSAISLYLYTTREAPEVSRVFDRVSFAVILPGYALVNVLLPLGAAAGM